MKEFEKATKVDKFTFLKILLENNFPISFKLYKTAHGYLEKNYPEIYKSFFSHYKNKEIKIEAKMIFGSFEYPNFKVQKLEYFSGDATRYNDSCYQVFTCPAYPNGIELKIPIDLIQGITILVKK